MQVPARHGHARIQCFPSQAVRHSWLSELEYLWSSSPPDGRPRDHPDLLEGKHVGICVLLRKGLRFQDVRHHEARLRQRAVPVSVRAMEIDLGTVLVLEDDRTPVEVTSLQFEGAVAGDREHRRGPGKGEESPRSEHAPNLGERPSDVLDNPRAYAENAISKLASGNMERFSTFDLMNRTRTFFDFAKARAWASCADEKSTPVTRAPRSARCTADCPPPQAISRTSFPATSEPRIFNSRSGGMDGPHSTSSSSSPRWLFW